MKFLSGKRAVLVLLAVALSVAPAMAAITEADLYFTEPNVGGLDVYTLGVGQYFADLHITVDTGAGSTGIASFVLTPGEGLYGSVPVNFVLLGTSNTNHVLGLSVIPAPTGGPPFDLTLDNVGRTLYSGGGGNPALATYQGNPGEQFDGFGDFNTGINSSLNGFPGAMTEVTFVSTQFFADTDAVLAALTGNTQGWLGAVDLGAYVTATGVSTGLTGMAHNGEPSGGVPNVPVPPTVWLMGSGLVGLGLMRWRRRQQ
jgi:hypothetical protein